MFIDNIRVFCKAGDGGNGVVHFRREKYIPKGGPDGGDGGDGGDIILEVSPHTDNLKEFYYDPKLIAKSGGHGGGARKHGKNGKTKIAKVPPGTVVYRSPALTIAEAVEMERSDEGIDLEPIADLTEYGERFHLCHGGKGGKGNWHYKSSVNRAPEEHTLGTEGTLGVYYFELRRIADAGMVGFPNAGKSTLVSKLSAATPKIAAYPFTTLKPMVGVVEFEGFRRCTVADIPGLIEGAHENRGLGHEFLRHVTRCNVLIFVIDMAAVDQRDPIEDLEILRKEVSLYDEELAKFEWAVVANKMDLPAAQENISFFRSRFPNVRIFPMSAMEQDGLAEFRDFLKMTVSHKPETFAKKKRLSEGSQEDVTNNQ